MTADMPFRHSHTEDVLLLHYRRSTGCLWRGWQSMARAIGGPSAATTCSPAHPRRCMFSLHMMIGSLTSALMGTIGGSSAAARCNIHICAPALRFMTVSGALAPALRIRMSGLQIRIYCTMQVASHAQKYFIRMNSAKKNDKRRSSIHDITTPAPPGGQPPLPRGQLAAGTAATARPGVFLDRRTHQRSEIGDEFCLKPWTMMAAQPTPVLPGGQSLVRGQLAAGAAAAAKRGTPQQKRRSLTADETEVILS